MQHKLSPKASLHPMRKMLIPARKLLFGPGAPVPGQETLRKIKLRPWTPRLSHLRWVITTVQNIVTNTTGMPCNPKTSRPRQLQNTKHSDIKKGQNTGCSWRVYWSIESKSYMILSSSSQIPRSSDSRKWPLNTIVSSIVSMSTIVHIFLSRK